MKNNEQTAQADAWPEPRLYKRKLRLEFSIYLSLLIVVLMPVTGYVITEHDSDPVSGVPDNRLSRQFRAYP